MDAGAVAAAVAEGGAVGATNAAGWSPLHHAAQIGAAGLLSEELLAAGADPHARTEVGSKRCDSP